MQILLQKESAAVNYFDALHKQDEKQKILIHDIRKHLSSIAELNEKNEPQKVASYIHEIIKSSDLQTSVRISDSDLLNTIIFKVKQQCTEFHISLITDVRTGCVDFLSEYDLTALFSNLLDNAVDAAKNIPNSFIELNISAHNHDSIIISMVNSCKKDSFTRSHRLTSTKKDKQNHGYGMKSI